MYHILVCLRDHRRTEVARYRYPSAQAAVRGRLEQLEAWVRVARLRRPSVLTPFRSSVMKKNEITVGSHYVAKVNGRLTTVRVDTVPDPKSARWGNPGVNTRYLVTNLATGRKTTFRSAAKFRSKAHEEKAIPLDRYQGLKNGTVKPESLSDECIAAGTEWYTPNVI